MSFTTVLFQNPGESWVFARVPHEHAPDVAGPWGRTPVWATVDGLRLQTSVWRTKQGDWLLSVSKKVRRGKGPGDTIDVRIEADPSRR